MLLVYAFNIAAYPVDLHPIVVYSREYCNLLGKSMQPPQTLDSLVRERLKKWPQRPPGMAAQDRDAWLRGRPSEDLRCHPFLKLPGSTRWRTLPDGLWLNFGGTPEDAYVDILAIEACGSLQNLLDKRSRFAPSTHSLLAVCPVP